MRSNGIAANRRSSFLIAILALIIASFVSVQETRAATPDRVLLQFSVTDCWGNPVRSALIRLVSPGGTTAILHYADERTASVPRGTYTVIANSPGFSEAAKTIHTDRQGGLISLCLTVGSLVELGGARGSSLSGSINQKHLLQRPAWVRLMGAYSDFNATAVVDEKGGFSFEDLQPGRYRLMLFGDGQLKDSRDIDVRGYSSKVTME